MSIIVQVSGATGAGGSTTTSVNDIVNCAGQDVRNILNSADTSHQTVLIDYVNRIHLDVLRHSRWVFLLSAPQTFNTVATPSGQTSPQNNQYWLGGTGLNPTGTIDTTLNLLDFDIIKRDSVIDYTNFKRLSNTELKPVGQQFTLPTKPTLYQILSSQPQLITLWPAPVGIYQISFRYYKIRTTLTGLAQIIQVPDRYKDIMCNGVAWLAYRYLGRIEEAQQYLALYEMGKRQIIKDANLFPRADEFIRPDPSAVTRQTTSGIGLDSGLETSIP